jgi:gamma-glutamyltranspeptidase
LKWDMVPSFGSLSGDTVYVAAVDRDGNAASLIQSLYGAFGSCVVAGNTGVILQNRGAYFSLDRNHPNRLEPVPSAGHSHWTDREGRRRSQSRSPFMHAAIKSVFPRDSLLPQPR